MSLYESWMKEAYNKEGASVDQVWNSYLPREQKIYEYILGEKVTNLSGTVLQLAERFHMTDKEIVGFIDGINDVLPEPYDMNTLEDDSEIHLAIDFEKLYKKMVEYKAAHLYSLPQWEGIFDEETRKRLMKEQKTSRTVVKKPEEKGGKKRSVSLRQRKEI